MLINDMVDLLSCEVLCGATELDQSFEYAFGSDLMSDVLAYVEEETLLLTGLTNAQVIRTAEMLDLKVVLFVRGKKPSEDVIELASENDIVLLTTNYTMYVTSGILYTHGLKGLSI